MGILLAKSVWLSFITLPILLDDFLLCFDEVLATFSPNQTKNQILIEVGLSLSTIIAEEEMHAWKTRRVQRGLVWLKSRKACSGNIH